MDETQVGQTNVNTFRRQKKKKSGASGANFQHVLAPVPHFWGLGVGTQDPDPAVPPWECAAVALCQRVGTGWHSAPDEGLRGSL